jgi:hypothetical protein
MKSKVKYIGIESRVQYEVLEAAIYDYLANGSLDKEKCLSHIKQFTKGENRAGKILKHITVLLNKNGPILNVLSKKTSAEEFSRLNISDRKSIILCLFCNSFPITYDILIGLAQAFKVQDILSKEVIVQKIGVLYGSNRSMYIAITEIIPLLIELGLIKRFKMGIYSPGLKLQITNELCKDLIIFTDIKLSGSKFILLDELEFKSWFSYFNLSGLSVDNFRSFLSKKESLVGNGYIYIH